MLYYVIVLFILLGAAAAFYSLVESIKNMGRAFIGKERLTQASWCWIIFFIAVLGVGLIIRDAVNRPPQPLYVGNGQYVPYNEKCECYCVCDEDLK